MIEVRRQSRTMAGSSVPDRDRSGEIFSRSGALATHQWLTTRSRQGENTPARRAVNDRVWHEINR